MVLTLKLNENNLKQTLKIMMAHSNIESMAELARIINKKETTFRSSISNNAIRISDFIQVAKSLGYELIVREKE